MPKVCKRAGRYSQVREHMNDDMIRRNSIIADAKFQTQQNLENSKNKKAVATRHELLVRSENNSHKYSLSYIVKCFEEQNIELQSVEIKPKEEETFYEHDNGPRDIYVQCTSSYEDLQVAEAKLREYSRSSVKRLSHFGLKHASTLDVPWFPRTAVDLDYCHHLQEKCEDDPITEDHPGYSDEGYMERRRKIVQIAQSYRHGEEIPDVAYTSEETKVWRLVYTTLKPLHEKSACSQYLHYVRELEKSGLYSADAIPCLQEVSKHIQERSGFCLRPVGGLLSARDFLASLAVKVFQCTQYIRHSLSPMHTPEPDCCHELIGHVPMLCDPEFARFSQEIGIISLGASDEEIEKLATLYWFTVEFGLCKQDGEIKVYGAGILSAFGEFEHALSGKPEFCDFDPVTVSVQPYQDSDYQPLYFVSSSFENALAKVRRLFAEKSIKKPFTARYDTDTASIQVMSKNNPQDVAWAVKNIKDHVDILRNLVE